MRLNDFITYWLDNIVIFECKKTTHRNYRLNSDKHIKPYFQDIELNDITIQHGLSFRKDLTDKGLKSSTINKLINNLKIILNKATELQYIPNNPLSVLKFIPEEDNQILPLNPEEIRSFKQSNLRYKTLYMVALYTGLRIGELAALRRSDIDLDNSVIRVSGSMSRFGRGTTKNKKIRIVPIHPHCKKYWVDLLSNLSDNDMIWNIDVTNFTNCILKSDCKKLGIRKIRFHDLRHTFATNYIKGGGKITHLSKILGHSSVNITMDIYVKIDEMSLLSDINQVRF